MLKCLRNVTEEYWKNVMNKEWFNIWTSPNVNFEFFSDNPQKLWENKVAINLDTITGTTIDQMFILQQTRLQKSKNISDYLKHSEAMLKSEFIYNSSKAVYKKAKELYKPKCIPYYYRYSIYYHTHFNVLLHVTAFLSHKRMYFTFIKTCSNM